MSCGEAIDDRNPFSAHRTRPAAIEYRFRPGLSADRLATALADRRWRGQITGPHGSGKSTLLAALRREFDARGWGSLLVELHDGQRQLPREVWQALRVSAPRRGPGVLIVDGYEQLSRWQRWRVRRAAARHGWGLLVAAHADCGLPTLVRTATDASLALELARQLHAEVDAPEVERVFAAQGGNLREVWFALYDLYEQRRSQDVGDQQPSCGA